MNENKTENNLENNNSNGLINNSNTNQQISVNNQAPNKTYPNSFIKFVDEHYFGISALLGCFYTITVIWVFIGYAYNTNELLNVLFVLYVFIFIAYIALYLGMTIAYKDAKYILSIVLGFIIGFFTCGGLFVVLTVL